MKTMLTHANRQVAAIAPLEGGDRESLALSAHPEFLKLIEHSRAQFAAGQTLTLDEMKKAVPPQCKSNQGSQPTNKRRARLK